MRIPFLAPAGILLVAAIGCRDDDATLTDPTAPPSAQVAAVTALAFWQLSAGLNHTCAVTTDFVPYCWGWNADGQLGNGNDTGPDTCGPAFAPQPCSKLPVAVRGGHRFRQVSTGEYHSCGVTGDNHVWCWGNGARGDLGTGATQEATTPVAVAGGHLFRQVTTGFDFTCAISYPDNKPYCWGANDRGQVGDGSLINRLVPVSVLGGLRLSQISAGGRHVCGVTTDSRAFCWGYNNVGQLGDSTSVDKRTRPRAVSGGRLYRSISAGASHTCAVTTSGQGFCWGDGRSGQIGNGKTYLSLWPRAVSGGLSLRRLSAGTVHTCAETTDSRAYCWGSNSEGELGTGGSLTRALTPVAVAGGLHFAQLDAGNAHTCGKTSSGVGYCWGDDFYGQLGDGTSGSEHPVPVPVAGPM
jgi:alpha-tubulin suppressor-like RCC1 family protein